MFLTETAIFLSRA